MIDDFLRDFINNRSGLAVGVVGEDREYVIALVSDAQARQRLYAVDIPGFAEDFSLLLLFSPVLLLFPTAIVRYRSNILNHQNPQACPCQTLYCSLTAWPRRI